jgi:hypothetical protein
MWPHTNQFFPVSRVPKLILTIIFEYTNTLYIIISTCTLIVDNNTNLFFSQSKGKIIMWQMMPFNSQSLLICIEIHVIELVQVLGSYM